MSILRHSTLRKARYKGGYSPNSAHVTGSRLLRKEKVDEYIKSKKDEIIDDTILSAKNIVSINTISYW